MNYKMIFNTAGKVVRLESALLLLSASVSVIYREWNGAFWLGATAVFAFIVGTLLKAFCRPTHHYFFAKEGLITVAVTWISVSLIGALPFCLSGEIPYFVDAFFETVSGFTTTGASILTDVESMSRGMLFWRSLTHWVGGMGVLVFILAVSPRSNDRSMHVLRAEMTGPSIDKLVPKTRHTTLYLYLIYLGLTMILVTLLLFGGMSLFESLVHAFGTMGTGGFSSNADSLASYNSYIQWVVSIFMILAGVNFNLYFFIFVGKVSGFFKSRELWAYISIILVSTIIVCLDVYSIYGNLPDAVRHSLFQVSSILTTTGFSTVDFNAWSGLSKVILIMLMFIGGCAGSTAGGLKVARIILIFKKIANDLKRVLHPRTATVVKLEGKRVSDETISGVTSYFAIYMVILFAVIFLLSLDRGIPGDNAIATHYTAAVACFNNIGPGLGSIIGPMGSYAAYSAFSKVVLSFAMLLGRLEIYPMLLTFNLVTWIKR